MWNYIASNRKKIHNIYQPIKNYQPEEKQGPMIHKEEKTIN